MYLDLVAPDCVDRGLQTENPSIHFVSPLKIWFIGAENPELITRVNPANVVRLHVVVVLLLLLDLALLNFSWDPNVEIISTVLILNGS